MSFNESEQYLKVSEAASEAAEDAYHAIEDGTVKGYKAIETGVVKGYKAVEDTVVGAYTKIEDAFVGKFLTREGETVEEAKARLRTNTAPSTDDTETK